jgi:putative redox protein
MSTGSGHRSVTVERTSAGHYTATNVRGGRLALGKGDTADFSPVELLLVAMAGCTGIDVDIVTSRRAEPDTFEVRAQADKVRDEQGNHLTNVELTFRIAFPDTEPGREAQSLVPGLVQASHDRLCTVGRTVEIGTPIANRIE